MAQIPAAHLAKKTAIHLGGTAADKVATMLARQNIADHTISQRAIAAGSVGTVGNAELQPQGNVCFFTGTPINGPAITELTDAGAAARLFPSWDGAFAGFFWDAERQTLVVATDCLGMQPLYMHHTEDGLTLVSETKAMDAVPDLAAWGAFISIGHPIGERSLVEGLRRVPPASILTYDCANQQLDIRRYWEWPEPSNAWRNYDFLGSLEQDICGYAEVASPGTLLLSGGFDSRLLLFLLKRADIPIEALIVAHEDEYDDADGRLAEAIAAVAQVPSKKVYPAASFSSSNAYLDYLKASDAGFPSLDLFISKVAAHINAPAVWEGLAPGFVFMPLHQPEGGFGAYLEKDVRGADSAIWQAARALFRPEVVASMSDGFAADLEAERARLPDSMPGLARFVIDNRSRHRPAMNPLKVYANYASVFTPGLSKDFMAHAATIPFDVKQSGRFYRSLLAQLDERALHVPVLSDGGLIKGRRRDVAYYREWLRIQYVRCRTRYPSLFPGRRRRPTRRSAFLDERLLEMDSAYLNPDVGDQLGSGALDSYAVWKLLFHWQTWCWVHEGRLDDVLA